MKSELCDTIAAIATAHGSGAIGIVRISGENSKLYLERIFQPVVENKMKPHKLTLGWIIDSGGLILDQALAVHMPESNSYCGEEMVEIQCHGGRALLNAILKLVIAQGARVANPGEFTLRAYLNGRMDLTQAEAVIDLISAPTKESANMAAQQLKGLLSQRIAPLNEILLKIIVEIEAANDFPEEVDAPDEKYLSEKIFNLRERIDELIKEYYNGKMYKEGLKVVILGRTNVGKSSLLNALVMQERAIVSSVPGTTRDSIEVDISIEGVPIHLVDTAGIRETENEIEIEGINRTKQEAETADIIVLVLEANQSRLNEEISWLENSKHQEIIIAINKSDLYNPNKIVGTLKQKYPEHDPIIISAKSYSGIGEIKKAIKSKIDMQEKDYRHPGLLNNIRHFSALNRARASLVAAAEAIELPQDLIVIDLRLAWQALGEICGQTADEEIIENIFASFCVGK